MKTQENSVSNLKEIGKIDYDRSATIWMLLLSSFLFIIGVVFLTAITGDIEFHFTGLEFINSALLLLITFLIIQFFVIIIHEYLHGIGVKLFKAKPIFGFMVLHKILPVAYTHVKGKFTKKQFNIILLLPLIVITLVGLTLSLISYAMHFEFIFYILFFSTTINLTGCAGDLYTLFLLYQYPSNIIVDNRELTDPLFILGDKDSTIENINPKISILIKGSILWVILTIIMEITLSVSATFLLLVVAPSLHFFNLTTLDLFFWKVIASSTGFSVETSNPIGILLFSMIISLLITLKYRNFIKLKDEEKLETENDKKPKTPFIA